MKGYEGSYYCENESHAERTYENSKKAANRVEEGRWVKGVSRALPVISSNGAEREKRT